MNIKIYFYFMLIEIITNRAVFATEIVYKIDDDGKLVYFQIYNVTIINKIYTDDNNKNNSRENLIGSGGDVDDDSILETTTKLKPRFRSIFSAPSISCQKNGGRRDRNGYCRVVF